MDNRSKSSKWKLVRVPVDLHAQLTIAAERMLSSHIIGYSSLPDEFVEHVPLHHVIKRGLDELESHRERSRRARRSEKHPAEAAGAE